jgi:hypothetical protein
MLDASSSNPPRQSISICQPNFYPAKAVRFLSEENLIVNNEELEVSLRTEIDNYLKSMFAEMRQEVAELQNTFDSEFERHRNQIRQSFEQLTNRSPQEVKVDDDFARLVAEHLRIAREDGANEVAEAITQQQAEAQPAVDFAQMRDAINEISAQTSQAEILKSLVKHSGSFAPRGALFIVKSEHLIGWRLFGAEGAAEEAVREVFLPLGNDSILTAATKNQTIERSKHGEHADDTRFLQKLDFGSPAEMTAIPLVVRGRGVAVLYADSGESTDSFNVEALETLVRVASMTVEMLASARNPVQARQSTAEQPKQQFSTFTEKPVPNFNPNRESQPVKSFEQQQPVSTSGYETAFNRTGTDYSTDYQQESYEENRPTETYETQEAPAQNVSTESVYNAGYETFSFPETQQPNNSYSDFAPQVEQKTEESSYSRFSEPETNEMQFGSPVAPAENFAPQTNTAPFSAPVSAEPQAAPQTTVGSGRRFGDRNVDLPIDVPEEERRLHNDARRFARLLVSEIKLYNELKVKEGRESGDLYERLREAIDRSREMYDKRVAPPVAAKFDYFHFELVNTLAEGEEAKLGREYVTANA